MSDSEQQLVCEQVQPPAFCSAMFGTGGGGGSGGEPGVFLRQRFQTYGQETGNSRIHQVIHEFNVLHLLKVKDSSHR